MCVTKIPRNLVTRNARVGIDYAWRTGNMHAKRRLQQRAPVLAPRKAAACSKGLFAIKRGEGVR